MYCKIWLFEETIIASTETIPQMYCMFRTLAGVAPTCCGWEWLTKSTFITPGSAKNIFCKDLNQSLAYLTKNGSSICTCKGNQRKLDPNACIALLNYTSVGSTCSSMGCPQNYRSYETGTTLRCDNGQLHAPTITLFETACQGRVSKT